MEPYLDKLNDRQNLTEKEIQAVMRMIMTGEASPSAMERFLIAMNMKGPTVEEITGAAKILRLFSVQIKTHHPVVLDTCGTGGDRKHTFNISTICALVVAACDVIVAKHGNRSVSSRCGSADLLEAMGVNIHAESDHLAKCLDQVGIAFLFAQKLHPAMKNIAPVRQKIGVYTIFNILGPLMNPAHATHQMMGVYRESYVETLAHVLKNLGLKRAIVVHGSDGLDEITTTGPTLVSEYNGQDVDTYTIHPEDYGLPRASETDLRGGELATNAIIAKDILMGGKGPKRDVVLLNSAFALYCAEKAADIYEGILLAEKAIDSGKAFAKLEALKAFTNSK